MGSSLNLRFKSVSFWYRNDPNHNNFDLDRFIHNPEHFLNWASKLETKVLYWLIVSKKNSVIISILHNFYCVSVIYFDAFYFICAPNGFTQDFYSNSKQDTRQRTALPDSPSQNKLLSGKAIVQNATWNVALIMLIHCRSWGPKLKISRHFWR